MKHQVISRDAKLYKLDEFRLRGWHYIKIDDNEYFKRKLYSKNNWESITYYEFIDKKLRKQGCKKYVFRQYPRP